LLAAAAGSYHTREMIGRGTASSAEEREFFAFLAAHFDPAYYLAAHPDASPMGIDPLAHWLGRGIAEGRQISPATELRFGGIAKRSSSHIWRHYRWGGYDIAARETRPIPLSVAAQVARQARHDPALPASTVQPRPQDRDNLQIDVAGLRRAISRRPEFVVIVSELRDRRGRWLAADLVAALIEAGFGPIQSIVADGERPEAFERFLVPEPFRGTNPVFWQDFWVHGPDAVKPGLLAQLVSVLRPRVTIVGDSRIGQEMLSRFGRGLSQRGALYSLFDKAAGADAVAPRHARGTLPFATALTDDPALAARLRAWYGPVLRRDIVELPRDAVKGATVAALFARQ
jgi:hypothetical protein